jgi:nucleoside-diphosphate-sugar epimerase
MRARLSEMARILITGHKGFTGRFLWKHLESLGHELLPFQVNGSSVDIRDKISVEHAVKHFRPEKIVHLAAVSSVDHEDVRQLYDVNITGTRNLLDAAAKYGRSLDTVIVASSANVYGNQSGQLSETSAVRPANDYAISKAATEMLAEIYKTSLPIVIARPFNYTGAGQSSLFVIGKIIEHLKAGKQAIQLGKVDVFRDFSDVRDICHCYERLLFNPEAIGEVYNLCSGVAVELQQIIEIASQIAGYQIQIVETSQLVRHNHIVQLLGNPAKINSLIGSFVRHDIRSTLTWMLAD